MTWQERRFQHSLNRKLAENPNRRVVDYEMAAHPDGKIGNNASQN
jgi:hypothetical protein